MILKTFPADPLTDLRLCLSLNLSPSFHADSGEPQTLDLATCALIKIPISETECHIFRRDSPTAFLSKRGAGPALPLDAVCLCVEMRESAFTEYLGECRRLGVQLVSLADRRELMEYLLNGVETTALDPNYEKPQALSDFLQASSLKTTEELQIVVKRFHGRNHAMTMPGKDFSWMIKSARQCVEQLKAKSDKQAKTEERSLLEDLQSSSKARKVEKVNGPAIIILPSGGSSLINLYNAGRFFGGSEFSPAEVGQLKPAAFSLKHPQTGQVFEFIDNPARLTESEWQRVRGCVVGGEAWQFKGWKLLENGSCDPPSILHRIKGVFFYYDDDKGEWKKGPVGGWPVTAISISRNRRHHDKTSWMQFWEVFATKK